MEIMKLKENNAVLSRRQKTPPSTLTIWDWGEIYRLIDRHRFSQASIDVPFSVGLSRNTHFVLHGDSKL